MSLPTRHAARTLLIPLASVAALAVTVAAPRHATAHDVQGFVSKSGLEFIAQQVPSWIPKKMFLDPMTKDYACMTAVQSDTEIDLTITDFEISIPKAGQLRLRVDFKGSGTGELWVDDIYACVGETTCQDDLQVDKARAIMDFGLSVAEGQPKVTLDDIRLDISPDDMAITFSDCALGDFATWVIEWGEEYILNFVLDKLTEVANDKLAPTLETMLAGFTTFEGSIGSADFAAGFDAAAVEAIGLALDADVDLSSKFPAKACVLDWDPGEPGDIPGPAPDLSEVRAQVGLAVNFGMVNDTLYHLWRAGFTCLTGDHLAALGVVLPVDLITALLPGFPPGSELGVELVVTAPPRVKGASGDGAQLVLELKGVQFTLTGELPDGSERSIEVVVDAEVQATVGIDPNTNALIATPDSVSLLRLELDQVYAAETGFDSARIQQTLETIFLPHLIAKMGTMPVTGPVFSALGYAAILRRLGSNSAYLTVHADLFKVPENDLGAPETTIIDYPGKLVSPKDAIIRLSGNDAMIPSELLRYVVSINGEASAPSYIKEFTVGEAGKSGTYEVSAVAMDLSGNQDLTPATVSVMVDGIEPTVLVTSDPVIHADGGPATVTWRMLDDLTPAELLSARIEIYRITDPHDALSVEAIGSVEVATGVTESIIEIPQGALYRAEIQVTDAVGNTSVATVMIDTGSGGGCSIGGGGAGSSSGIATLLLAFAVTLTGLGGLHRRRTLGPTR